MAEPARETGTKRLSSTAKETPLKYACDAGFLPDASSHGDTPESMEFVASDGEEESDQSSESERESGHATDLAENLRVVSESILRTELVELEMIKKREASRLEAEKRRMELETQLTRMMMQTQLQIASFVCRKSSTRKRKRSGDVSLGPPDRDGAVLSGSLLCNMISGLDQFR